MSRYRLFFGIVFILSLPFALGGCPAAIVGGLAAAGGAGYAANQERGVGGGVDDFSIKTNIQSAWIHANPAMQADLNVTVYEGRTLLTGMAPTPEVKAQAKEIASRVAGVRVVCGLEGKWSIWRAERARERRRGLLGNTRGGN